MGRLALLVVILAACSHERSSQERPSSQPKPQGEPASAPQVVEPPPTTPPPATPSTRVELTSVTLADDCGGTPPWSAPAPTANAEPAATVPAAKSKLKEDSADPSRRSHAQRRRCEQTSMQLAIIARDAANLDVKSVELFDEAGTSLGSLAASKPTRWSDSIGSYEPWDQTVAAGSTSNVSFVLAQPAWDQIGDRWNRTYTLKTVLSVGGVEQTAQRDVVLSAPASLPPNVKT